MHVPERPEFPEEIEQSGVSAPPTQFTAQVTDDTGQNLVTPTDPQPVNSVSVQIPADQQQLSVYAQGDQDDSKTWNAFFWLRIIKKALKKGWRVVVKGGLP